MDIYTLFLVFFISYICHFSFRLWLLVSSAALSVGFNFWFLLEKPLFYKGPLELLIGGLLSVCMFILALYLTAPVQHIKQMALLLFKKKKWLNHSRVYDVYLHLLTSCFEECFWRLSAQSLFLTTFPATVSVPCIALMFWSTHTHLFRVFSKTSLELFMFSCVMGVFAYLGVSYVSLVLIHTVRNLGITYYMYNVELRQ